MNVKTFKFIFERINSSIDKDDNEVRVIVPINIQGVKAVAELPLVNIRDCVTKCFLETKELNLIPVNNNKIQL